MADVDCSCNETRTCHGILRDYVRFVLVSSRSLLRRSTPADLDYTPARKPLTSNFFRRAAWLRLWFQTPRSTRRSMRPCICLSHSQPGGSERRSFL